MAYLIAFNIIILIFINFTSLAKELDDNINQYELNDLLDNIHKKDRKSYKKLKNFLLIYYDIEEKSISNDSIFEILKNSFELYSTKEYKSKLIAYYRLNTNYLSDSNQNFLYDNSLKIKYNSELINSSVNIFQKNSFKKEIDFLSGFIEYQAGGYNLTIGNYSNSLGLGLILGNEFRSNSINNSTKIPFENQKGINGYSSLYDGLYFRGLAIEKDYIINNSILNFKAFFSLRDKKSKIINDTIKTIYYGNFNSNYNYFQENIYGINVDYSISKSNFGIVLTYLNYSKPVLTQSIRNFYGKNGFLSSFYSRCEFNNNYLGSEIAFDNNFNPAIKSYLSYIKNKNEFSIGLRYYSNNYISPFSTSYGSKNYSNNEIGCFLAYSLKREDGFLFNSSLDIYKEANFNKIYDFGWYLNLSIKKSNKNNIDYEIYSGLSNKYNPNSFIYDTNFNNINIILNLKLRLNYRLYKNLNFITKIDYKKEFVNNNNSNNGYGIRIEAKYTIIDKLFFAFETTYFITDNFQTAIWSLERIHQNYYILESNYSEGNNFGINIDYYLFENFRLSIKYYLKEFINDNILTNRKKFNLELGFIY